MDVRKNERYTVTIEGITSEGSGVARIDGFAVFVPGTAAGDVARIKVVKVLRHYAYGILEELETPSPDRIENDCPVFRQCGGCCYRHISYEAELRLKQQQVEDAFARLGKISLKPEPIAGSEQVDAYRNKAQFPIGVNAEGKAVTGFFAPRSHRIVPCGECRLLPPEFYAIARDVVRFLNKHRLRPYDETTRRGVFRHVYLRRSAESGAVMLCLVAARPVLPREEELIRFLTGRHPEIRTVVVNHNPEPTNVILGREERVVFGGGTITDRLCGVEVEISPRAFYQVNHPQAERLYRQAIEYAGLTGGEVLFDLYCGIGTIGLAAAGQARLLIGAEIVPEAVENARENAARNGFSNTRFLCADCKEAVRLLEEEGQKPDVLIVDPPRKGCDPEVLDSIARLSPARVVMVSCNPATAARDCRLLAGLGWRVEAYRPFDLFPRTRHVECVVKLVRAPE